MLLDAVRISDKQKVVLKRVRTSRDVAILEHLHSPSLKNDPRNNSVPIFDVIYLPDRKDEALIMMPMLYIFEASLVPFEHVSEISEALDQFLKGLEFLHECQIAHRDACWLNLMMDATKVIPGGHHFAKTSRKPDGKTLIKHRSRRSVAPVKYYFVDYETALFYPGNKSELYGKIGQDRTVPEFADESALYDPFKLDVYQLGGVITELMERYAELHFLGTLEKRMKCQDPSQRLIAAQAYKEFCDITASLKEEELSLEIKRIPPDPSTVGQRRVTAPIASQIAVKILRCRVDSSELVASSSSALLIAQYEGSLDSTNVIQPSMTPEVLHNTSGVAGIVTLHPAKENLNSQSNTSLTDSIALTCHGSTSIDTSRSISISPSQSIFTLRSIDTLPTSVDTSEQVQVSQVAEGSYSGNPSKPSCTTIIVERRTFI